MVGLHRRGLVALWVVLLIGTPADAQRPTSISNHLAVLHCDESRGALSPQRAALALRYAADELGIPTSELPRIVVIRCTAASADVALVAVGQNGGGVESIELPDMRRKYGLWIVGTDPDPALVRGLVTILGIDLKRRGVVTSLQKQEEHMRRVYIRLTASISAEALQLGSNQQRR